MQLEGEVRTCSIWVKISFSALQFTTTTTDYVVHGTVLSDWGTSSPSTFEHWHVEYITCNRCGGIALSSDGIGLPSTHVTADYIILFFKPKSMEGDNLLCNCTCMCSWCRILSPLATPCRERTVPLHIAQPNSTILHMSSIKNGISCAMTQASLNRRNLTIQLFSSLLLAKGRQQQQLLSQPQPRPQQL